MAHYLGCAGGGFAFDSPPEPEDLSPEAGGGALGDEFGEPPPELLPVFL